MSTQDVRVSVIIPTYGRPEALVRCIRSVLSQTLTAFELIVVDDASPEPLTDVFRGISHPRIIFTRHAVNRGAPAARNTGIALSRGQFIAFLDDDDEWSPDFLEKMVARFERLPARVGVLQCGFRLVDGQKTLRVARPRHRGNVHRAMLEGDKSAGIIGLFRREVLEKIGGFDETLPAAQDWDLGIRASGTSEYDFISDVLVTVHVDGSRISSNPERALKAREIILPKYADEFAKHPAARAIHLKRMGKIHALAGRWPQAQRVFHEAALVRPDESFKVLAWLSIEYPLLKLRSLLGGSLQVHAVVFGFLAAAYSQASAILNPFVINDDAAQHIWWMAMWRDPLLFTNDFLAQYAISLQNFGILGLYRLAAFVADPLAVSKFLPLVLVPLTCFFTYRLVFRLSGQNLTAFLAASGLAVTHVFIEFIAGGHAHSFGFPLLAMFICFLSERRWKAVFYVLICSVLFFPVIFALGLLSGFLALAFSGEARKSANEALMYLLGAAAAGGAVLWLKFSVFADPALGHTLSRFEVANLPELAANGRWPLWPVPNVFEEIARSAGQGLFIWRTVMKSAVPSGLKMVICSAWTVAGLWLALLVFLWRRQRSFLTGVVLPTIAAGVILYLVSAAVVLKLYAPDRYVMYSTAFLTLTVFFLALGQLLESFKQPALRRVAWILTLALVLLNLPLVRSAGLKDYSARARLYQFVKTLPRQSVIVSSPEAADGIPLFSRRTVLFNKELSVPLYDQYWKQMKALTRDFFNAYYADDVARMTAFMDAHHADWLIIDQRDFDPAVIAAGAYFEPFARQIRQLTAASAGAVLATVPGERCAFLDSGICVISRANLQEWR